MRPHHFIEFAVRGNRMAKRAKNAFTLSLLFLSSLAILVFAKNNRLCKASREPGWGCESGLNAD